MAFLQPRRWRCLERHPLSAEYPDLSPAARERMTEGLKAHGNLDNRKIIVHEGKVLDGWQFYTSCIDADLKPTFAPLPKGITPEEYVEIKNDSRRHETQETAIARAVARRERVAAARAKGESLRTIAEKEGVSPETVRHDLQASGVQGGQVKGQDGKTYPASRLEEESNGESFSLQAPYALGNWNRAYEDCIRQVRLLGESFDVSNSPPIHGLNRLLKELDKNFRKTHKELSKRKKVRD